MAALQVEPSMPFWFPSIKGMFPMGMPNMIMQTERMAVSSVTSRSRGSISRGSANSFIAEKIYSLGLANMFRRSVWARVKPTATKAMGEVTFPR